MTIKEYGQSFDVIESINRDNSITCAVFAEVHTNCVEARLRSEHRAARSYIQWYWRREAGKMACRQYDSKQ